MTETLLRTGGVFCLAFFVFHLFFWRLFDWKRDLQSLTFLNRAIMPVLNLCLMFVFLSFGYVSLAHTAELVSTALGRSLVTLIALLWLFRAILQVVYFRLRHWGSWAFLGIFLLGSALYALPALQLTGQAPSEYHQAQSD